MFKFHSQNKPNERNTMKINREIKFNQARLNHKTKQKGNMSTNSISKIRKIKVSKKNCRENLSRLFMVGIKPHSKGLRLINSKFDFLETTEIISSNRSARLNPTITKHLNIMIIIFKLVY
jgi:formylmethanofuran dehydrogenase subunit C